MILEDKLKIGEEVDSSYIDDRLGNLPNNNELLHRSGDEVKSGKLTLKNTLHFEEGLFFSQFNCGRVVNPKGGSTWFYGSTTGAIKIKLPVLWSSSHIRFVVKMIDYSGVKNSMYEVGGVLASSMDSWANTFAYNLSDNKDADLPVRFGHDGSNACVWIGETTTVSQYRCVSVPDVIIGFEAVDDRWAKGWAVSAVTEFDTVQITKSNNFPFSDWNKMKNKPTGASGTYTSQDGKIVTVENGIIISIV